MHPVVIAISEASIAVFFTLMHACVKDWKERVRLPLTLNRLWGITDNDRHLLRPGDLGDTGQRVFFLSNSPQWSSDVPIRSLTSFMYQPQITNIRSLFFPVSSHRICQIKWKTLFFEQQALWFNRICLYTHWRVHGRGNGSLMLWWPGLCHAVVILGARNDSLVWTLPQHTVLTVPTRRETITEQPSTRTKGVFRNQPPICYDPACSVGSNIKRTNKRFNTKTEFINKLRSATKVKMWRGGDPYANTI